MKVLVIGAAGFIGRAVTNAFAKDHEVYGADRSAISGLEKSFAVDLTAKQTILDLLAAVKPDAVINCAGIVDATQNVDLNEVFTRNLLESAAESGLSFKRIIVLGSAGEYGLVDPKDIPVKETAPRNAPGGYGMSKLKEVDTALELAKQYNLPVTVARLFNPIGAGMHPRMLTSNIANQIAAIKRGENDHIEIGRLDTERDFVNVKDIATAIKALVEGEPKEMVYNVGSGKPTSIGKLVKLMVDAAGLQPAPKMVETLAEPEKLVAIQADISRLQNEFGWQPTFSIEDAVKEIIDATQ